jgi:hypothetical protein
VPAYAFSVGETLLPWRPLALAGMLVALPAAAAGIVGARRRRGVLPLLLGCAPILTTALAVAMVRPTTNVVTIPSRAVFALPVFLLAVANGLLPRRRWRRPGLAAAVLLALLLLADAAAWRNYFAGRDFVNPVYVMPSRELAERLAAGCRAGDLVLAPADSVLGHYLPRTGCPARLQDTADRTGADAALARGPARVYLVRLGRDSTREADPRELRRWLDEHYRLVGSTGYAEQDETYRGVKRWLLGHEAYRYKIVVDEYQPRAGGGTASGATRR